MFERFTGAARRVLVLAQMEAKLLRHNVVGTEHILVGLIQEGQGHAAKALGLVGVSSEAVRDRVEAIGHEAETAVGPAGNVPPGSLPFTSRVTKVLELSVREALQLGHDHIGTAHLLLGVLREREAVGRKTLVALGVDLSGLRQAVIELVSSDEHLQTHDWPMPRTTPADQSDAPERGGAGLVPGATKAVEVVQVGRSPVAFDLAYRELTRLAAAEGVDLNTADPEGVRVRSVPTDDGPGLLVSYTWAVEGSGVPCPSPE